jgi:hypothetical protein
MCVPAKSGCVQELSGPALAARGRSAETTRDFLLRRLEIDVDCQVPSCNVPLKVAETGTCLKTLQSEDVKMQRGRTGMTRLWPPSKNQLVYRR